MALLSISLDVAFTYEVPRFPKEEVAASRTRTITASDSITSEGVTVDDS